MQKNKKDNHISFVCPNCKKLVLQFSISAILIYILLSIKYYEYQFKVNGKVREEIKLPLDRTAINTIKKYIFYECGKNYQCGGLADRFKGIVNAYAWSLLTNRTFVMSITRPCDFTNLIIPNEIDWDYNIDKLVRVKKLPENYSYHEFLRLHMKKGDHTEIDFDIRNYHKDSDLIKINSNVPWMDMFSKNKFVHIFHKKIWALEILYT